MRALLLALTLLTARSHAATVLIEAESFANPGGWVLDTQFIETLGSPYLNPWLQPYVATGYRYRGAKEDGAARYAKVEKAGDYEVRVSYSPHENRATNTRVLIERPTA